MEMIWDNAESNCREVHYAHMARGAAIIMSIPRIAIELKLTPLYAPWGTYPKPTGWGQHNGARVKKQGQRSGVKRSEEETALLRDLFERWTKQRKGKAGTNLEKFMAMQNPPLPPQITKQSMANFFVMERRRRQRSSQRTDLPRSNKRIANKEQQNAHPQQS